MLLFSVFYSISSGFLPVNAHAEVNILNFNYITALYFILLPLLVVGIGLKNPNRLIGEAQRRLIESNRFLGHTGNFTKFLP